MGDPQGPRPKDDRLNRLCTALQMTWKVLWGELLQREGLETPKPPARIVEGGALRAASCVLPGLHLPSDGHLQGRGRQWGNGRPAEQHEGLRDMCPLLHGHHRLCGREVREQVCPDLPGLRHPLHPGYLRGGHQVCLRPPLLSVSALLVRGAGASGLLATVANT